MMKQYLIWLSTAVWVSAASNSLRFIPRSTNDDLGMIYGRSSSGQLIPRFEEHSSYYLDHSNLYRRSFDAHPGILQSRGDRSGRVGSSGRGNGRGAGQPGQSQGQAGSNRPSSPGRASRQGNDSPGHWRGDRVPRPDDARVHVDNHGTDAHAMALPWHLSSEPAWGRPGHGVEMASARHVTGMTLSRDANHKTTTNMVGNKVAGTAGVIPGGSAILKATGADGTDTKIIGHGMQDTAVVSAQAGNSGKPASLSIKQMGPGGVNAVGTKSADDQLPSP